MAEKTKESLKDVGETIISSGENVASGIREKAEQGWHRVKEKSSSV